MCFRERRVGRGAEEQELGHGQPPARDPGAAEVTEAAPRSAGVRPGGRAAQCAAASLSRLPRLCTVFCQDQGPLSPDFDSLVSPRS